MGARAQLVAALTEMLPDSWDVLDAAKSITAPDPTVPAVVAVQRLTIAPAPAALAGYVETYNIWLIEPSFDMDFVDDNLDEHLEAIFTVLDPVVWLVWNVATRDLYDETYHAYRIEVTINTEKD